MKTRIITGLVVTAVVVAVLFSPPIVAYCAFAAVCAMAVWEVLSILGITKHRFLTLLSLLFAVVMPFAGWFKSMPLFLVGIAVFFVGLAVCQLCSRDSLRVRDTAMAFFMTLILSLGISCAVYSRTIDDFGLLYMSLVLMIAWGGDMGAYFVGSFWGKHKLCPTISPKKTVEGFFGGWACSVISNLIVALIWNLVFAPSGVAASYVSVAVLAAVLAPFSVLGDLFASVVKRRVGAKDYGNIMPGHGGMMDRFDSLLFVAPLFFAALQIFRIV